MRTTRKTALLICCCLHPLSAFGQSTLSGGGAGVGQKLRPGQEALPLTEPGPSKPSPELALPPLAPRQDSGRLSSQLRVYVQKFSFSGNRVISDQELNDISAPYEGRIITSAELQQLRDRIGRYYLARGYINSGAVIPDQKVEANIVKIQIIEGRLTRVEVAGDEKLGSGYLADRLLRAAGEPLSIHALEEELKTLQQDILIKRLNAELRPGERLGEGILLVQVEEDIPAHATVSFNNHRPPSVSGEQVELDASWYSLTGHRDQLRTYFGHTEGLDDFFLSYNFPFNSYDTRLGMYFEYTDSEVTEAPFDDLDIESTAKTWGISLTHPLQRTPAGHLTAGIALERRHANTELLGIPFSFAEGVPVHRLAETGYPPCARRALGCQRRSECAWRDGKQ
jgi:hemolysin activation/secretion protein